MSEQELLDAESVASRNRLIGAVVWLLLLVILVPVWYNNPVNFKPSNVLDKTETQSAVVGHAFVVPESSIPEESINSQFSKTSGQLKTTDAPDNAKKVMPVTEAAPSLNNVVNPVLPITIEEAKFVWILRLVAYKNKEMAEEMKDRLKYDYEAFVKYFPKSGYYSVRIGPYLDEARAKKDQIELNRLLRVKSELVKITPSAL